MCLIAFAIQASSRWPLVIAANRDEFFDRPTLPLSRWQAASGRTIFSGRDLRAGGTWLGMADNGRVAFLTNVRQAVAGNAARSRGELVTRWLDGDTDAITFMAQTHPADYGGFNLVVGNVRDGGWTWLSNRSFGLDSEGAISGRAQSDGWQFRHLEPGIYGLSNAALDTPWPKTLVLKASLLQVLEAPDQDAMKANLWTALANRQRVTPDGLPDTGLPISLEEMLSSAFVEDASRAYGTRCSTLLAAQHGEVQPGAIKVSIWERTWQIEPGKNSAREACVFHTL